jgi:hypothetical protein
MVPATLPTLTKAYFTHVDRGEGMADEWEDASVAELHVEDHAAIRGHELRLVSL